MAGRASPLGFLEELSRRRRFGMRPGLETTRALCAALGNPERRLRAVHVAGTNGKGATCAILDAAFAAAGLRSGRYTSPHLVRLNERFFLDGAPLSDVALDAAARRISALAAEDARFAGLTFFEALTAVAFAVYAEAFAAERSGWTVLETGLGGRLDATNVCVPQLAVITRVGLDHCDWLGDTVAKIAAEKAGIVKPGVPIVLGANVREVRDVVETRAREVGAPFFYAPDVADDTEIPKDFSLAGRFNRENAVTALASLRVLAHQTTLDLAAARRGFARVVWPGRFQRVRNFVVDGAHNPPAASALAEALREAGLANLTLVAGFCGDKDVDTVLATLAPYVSKGIAVRTNNPRSLAAEETARRMANAGISSRAAASLQDALTCAGDAPTLVCGSLFLAGEALVALGAYPWPTGRFDASELLHA